MRSLWQKNTELPHFEPLRHDAKTDVLIIGGGLAGLLTAYGLQRAGVEHLLIEADTICSGTTGGTTAKITSQHGLSYARLFSEFGAEKARMYWEANEAALARYRRLCREYPCDLEEKDSFIYERTDASKLERELSVLSRLNIPAEFVSAPHLPFRTLGAVAFRAQAQFDPLKFIAGLAPQLNICEHTAALAVKGKSVVTTRGTITAEKIVVATHFPFLDLHGAYFLKLFQQRSYVLALEGAPRLDGMYRDAAEDGLSFRSHGDKLLLGGASHRTGKESGAWGELEKAYREFYPKAHECCRWAAQDCVTLDGVPYIGRYGKRTENLFVAAGFNKWGVTSSMVAAQLLCDLVLGRENAYAQVFAPQRTLLRPQLLNNMLESTANLLTLRTPRCPHLGCALKWNDKEHSWDCPCHGSRFSETGELLDDPADKDLDLEK